jgi:hypothetical protein
MTSKVVTANRLTDGLVVYLGYAGWTEDMHLARRANDDASREELLALAGKAVGANEVADAWLIDIDAERAVRRRERIRAAGPTVRPDLGYQAARSA